MISRKPWDPAWLVPVVLFVLGLLVLSIGRC